MNKSNYKKIAFWLLVLVVILIIVVPKFIDNETDEKVPQLQKSSAKKELLFNGIIASYTSMSKSVFATGTLLSDEEIELKSEISGKITKLNIKEGSPVKRGDLQKSIKDLTIAIEINPNFAEAYTIRGVIKGKHGDNDGAYVDLKKASELGYLQANDFIKTNCE
ncbi:MAG: biotin/lipoyl-binding protein [Candidatus Kapabacteria bacterium]|nr:biotin/lipoyl-binding protein [Candidatus Kapabacteria bacterium]